MKFPRFHRHDGEAILMAIFLIEFVAFVCIFTAAADKHLWPFP